MNGPSLILAAAAGALTSLLCAAPAAAQLHPETWVSSTSSAATNCGPRNAPCGRIFSAIGQTTPGGQVHCLDALSLNNFGIRKSVSVVCDTFRPTSYGINISPGTAAAAEEVTLSGLDINCTETPLLIGGMTIEMPAVVHLRNMQIRNCDQAGFHGIEVVPTSGVVELHVSDSLITNSGGAAGAGIFVRPTGSASVVLHVTRTQIENNNGGIRIDSRATTGTIRGTITDTVITGSPTNGVAAVSSSRAAALLLERVTISGNSTGIAAHGANTVVLVDDSGITANGIGIAATGGGQVVSFKNNVVAGNTSGGETFSSSSLGLK